MEIEVTMTTKHIIFSLKNFGWQTCSGFFFGRVRVWVPRNHYIQWTGGHDSSLIILHLFQ